MRMLGAAAVIEDANRDDRLEANFLATKERSFNPLSMADYRRVFVPGATYFFTLNLADRRSDLLV